VLDSPCQGSRTGLTPPISTSAQHTRHGHSPYGLGPRDDTRAVTLQAQIRHYPTSTSTIASWGHFKPSRWGQAKPSLSASNMTLARAPLATDDQER
jgi:hypothetical protein